MFHSIFSKQLCNSLHSTANHAASAAPVPSRSAGRPRDASQVLNSRDIPRPRPAFRPAPGRYPAWTRRRTARQIPSPAARRPPPAARRRPAAIPHDQPRGRNRPPPGSSDRLSPDPGKTTLIGHLLRAGRPGSPAMSSPRASAGAPARTGCASSASAPSGSSPHGRDPGIAPHDKGFPGQNGRCGASPRPPAARGQHLPGTVRTAAINAWIR